MRAHPAPAMLAPGPSRHTAGPRPLAATIRRGWTNGQKFIVDRKNNIIQTRLRSKTSTPTTFGQGLNVSRAMSAKAAAPATRRPPQPGPVVGPRLARGRSGSAARRRV